MFRWLLESPYLAIRELRACFAVSYDISSRNRNRISLSFISITSSRLNPLIVPSSFTSCTIRRTLWVNLPIKLLEPPPVSEWVDGKEKAENDTRVMSLACINLALCIEKSCRTCGFHLDDFISFIRYSKSWNKWNRWRVCRVACALKMFRSFTSNVHSTPIWSALYEQ